ncbi:MAG: GNAT family N-acetyltransferase [Flavobacteriaceae bacterium]|nr:GNAT family N-acetyltransferase [Flavobacteriaceae bacterium]MDP4674163.1 GNAT family N-acetyltransferase [Flavobacteriaceae bacterium]MDP4754061.1 GNAT family N-acetyltransferase [Flavobacteriaceae bacterium]MDP4793957.1 GNAT family N-acetyltransferase [Flavobacteriaceae bacterium]MDP4886329.1 GNAT family N-acetyltransferase [Flavobacteriaceae bacterium]
MKTTELHWEVYTWEDLPKDRLYTVLALRSEVFVVEQNCPYQDVDGKDLKALHLLGVQNGVLAAYARLFGPGDYFEQASIGRVVTSPTHRGLGQGKQLMKQAIASLEHRWGKTVIHISAQAYLEDFYQGFGFVRSGENYLEDDIPHLKMLRNPSPQS